MSAPAGAQLRQIRSAYLRRVCREILSIDASGVATNADADNAQSRIVALKLAGALGAPAGKERPKGQSSGTLFEEACSDFLEESLKALGPLRPGAWHVGTAKKLKIRGVGEFAQYKHLLALQGATERDSELAAALGRDYEIRPDVLVCREPLSDAEINGKAFTVGEGIATYSPLRAINSKERLLHAVISCKWTIRSDRSQNARTEALNLLRNRKGRAPHIVVVTGEPLASRIGSIALGTGDVDCTYHFALHELLSAYEASGYSQDLALLRIMLDGRRLRDISDLPLDLVI
jgi:hypothetical protein